MRAVGTLILAVIEPVVALHDDLRAVAVYLVAICIGEIGPVFVLVVAHVASITGGFESCGNLACAGGVDLS